MARLTIALIVSSYSGHDQGTIRGAMQWARDRGNTEILVESNLHSKQIPPYSERYLSRCGVSGVIAHVWNTTMLSRLKGFALPVVDTGGSWPDADLPSVHVDNIAVGRMAARHLLDKGLRSFAFWGAPLVLNARHRRDGFVGELRTAGFDCAIFERSILWWPMTQKQLTAALRWLEPLVKPVGMMCWFNSQAIVAERLCRLAGLSIPQDVALISADMDTMSELLCTTALTSIDVNASRIGYKAMDVLHRMIQTGKRPARSVIVPPRSIVVRESTDILAIGNRNLAHAVRYILNNADRPISVRDVLREVPVSRRYLEMHFKDLFGRTPRQQIQHAHIERAKVLLEDGDLSIAKITELSGLKDRATFSRLFKRLTQCSPAQYRKRIGHRKLDD